jgi:HlyD family secretion protein
MNGPCFVFRTTLVVAAFILSGCSGSNNQTFQGWIEANLIFVAPDEAGRVETMSVREGNVVTAGAPLFTVDADLQEADVVVATASAVNARQAFVRAEQLLKANAGTQKNYEDAEAALRSAEARLNSARTRLARRKVFSPVSGMIQQIYYRQGEMVPAGRPAVAVLPPDNVKVRFFIPEAMLPNAVLGDIVKVRCDGCKDEIEARISFVSNSSEFTPPVIYSLEERSKLVFLVEARTDRPETVRVGQPVSVQFARREQR